MGRELYVAVRTSSAKRAATFCQSRAARRLHQAMRVDRFPQPTFKIQYAFGLRGLGSGHALHLNRHGSVGRTKKRTAMLHLPTR